MKKIALIAILLIGLLVFVGCKDENTPPAGTPVDDVVAEDTYHCTVAQKDDEQKILVKWDKNTKVQKVEITVKHGETVVDHVTVDGAALVLGSAEVNAYYGKHTVSVITTDENGRKTSVTKDVALSADEYVIAPISGSMPQLYFTLYMDEITNDHEIPAFVWLARPGSWNWANLPDNVYAMPTVAIDEVLTHNNYDRMVEVTDAYIEELYSINPDAKFNLYINDYNSYLYLKLLVANGIPEENYYVTLLSDGGASNSAFNEVFNIEEEGFDADVVYAEMADKLDTLYTEVAAANDYNWTQEFTVTTSEFNQYSYVAAKEKSNVEWWLPRPRAGVLCSTDEEFINTVLTVDTVKTPNENRADNVIIERNFANPLTALTEEEAAELKAFYRIGDDMFEAADSQGKKAMMILGSWASPENEPDFEAYVKLVKKVYGDDYVYFYKGHPNTPTALYPDKQAQLEELDLIDVESTINAELILFFFPDIYMCGYSSSTFTSVYDEEMACALFNVTKDDAYSSEDYQAYRDLIGLFFSKIEDTSAYAECTDASHEYFLVEYNHVESAYQYSIYDATTDTIINGPAKA